MIDEGLLAYRAQLGTAATRLARAHTRRRRRRVVFTAVVATAALAATATTLAATGVLQAWLGGEAAPPEVQRDFAGIPEELGYSPVAGEASKVAQEPDGTITLYATPTKQGGYCLVADVPWLEFAGDGRGYCVKPEAASRPLVAGLIGQGPGEGEQSTSVLAGRVLATGAAIIRFTGFDGRPVERRLGAGGFFVAALEHGPTCKAWSPVMTAADEAGNALASQEFPLVGLGTARIDGAVQTLPGVCVLRGPISDLEAARAARPR